MRKRASLYGIGALTVILLFIVLVPLPYPPSGDTRMILDHTLQVYVAPPCFTNDGFTNFLSETTWAEVKKTDYKPESACTEDKLQPVKRTIWNRVLEAAGLVPSPWKW